MINNIINSTIWDQKRDQDIVECVNCQHKEEIKNAASSYPDGKCPKCSCSWTGGEKKSTIINITMPDDMKGGVG